VLAGRILVLDGRELEADLATVDVLARITLEARRGGRVLQVRHASDELRDLLALAGLTEVIPCRGDSVVEVRRQPEHREELLGVKEEGDRADPIA
jgi:hypothetical protein